jgi:hypothetical protein
MDTRFGRLELVYAARVLRAGIRVRRVFMESVPVGVCFSLARVVRGRDE